MDLRRGQDAEASAVESPALDGFRKTAKLPASGGLWGEMGSRVGGRRFPGIAGLEFSQNGNDGNI